MGKLHLPATESTPAVVLDPDSNRLEVRGVCNPAKASALFDPMLQLLEKHFSVLQPRLFTVYLDIGYLERSCAQALRGILDWLDAQGRVGRWIIIIWASPDDPGQRNLGLALTEGLLNLDVVTDTAQGVWP